MFYHIRIAWKTLNFMTNPYKNAETPELKISKTPSVVVGCRYNFPKMFNILVDHFLKVIAPTDTNSELYF